MDEIRLDPKPGILIESLRDIGYSFNTALADIIDNSISAGATKIDVRIPPADELSICIVDNGAGLLREQLLEAMRLGSTDPRDARDKQDLGRFGLGMKTASFSQCRRLTVVSKVGYQPYGFVWDLDDVVESNSWTVKEVENVKSLEGMDLLPDKGTLVLWEKIDRLSDNRGGKPNIERIIDEASDHLSLVFHRYLSGERGINRVVIRINNRKLEPIDPFNSRHKATQVSPDDVPMIGVAMRAYTLPSRDNYSTKAEYDKYSLGDYLKNQGIYLYRAKRLIIYGTWLGLAKKSAVTQLCRVRIDIDNAQDELWKIDVKKASAQLPENVRSRVRTLIQHMVKPSRRVYHSRGAKQVDESVNPVWNLRTSNDKAEYSINRSHPSICAFRDSLPTEEDRQMFDAVVGLIESGFPVKSMFYNMSTAADDVSFASISDEGLRINAENYFATMKVMGTDEQTILSIMRQSEPFASNWSLTCKLLGIEERNDG